MRARRGFALLIPCAAVLASTVLIARAPASPAAGTVQAPEAFFGFRMGADRELADWPAIVRYFEATSAASDRVELVDAGPTTDGRRMVAAIVSAPANIARLDEIQRNALRLADPRTLDEAAARAIIARQPVIIAIGMSIHATEIGGTQTAPELLYALAASADPEVLRLLDNVVVILLPSLNPDGHVLTVDWYRRNKGSEFEGAPMPWLYHRYGGHDLNRDGFMMNLAENRTLADFFYRRWHPQVFLTMHQMGPRGPRYFVPPNTDPIDLNYDPLIWRTAGLLGHAMALALEQEGRSGVAQGALYDYFWPGYEDSAPLGHNTVTLLTEAASAQVATPITVTPEEFVGGRGLADQQPSITYPHPWPGGTWRLRDIVDYNLSAAQGLLQAAARYRADLLGNFFRMGQRQVQLGLQGGPFAFVIPPDQYDVHAATRLEEILIDGAVEVHRAIQPFRVADTVYPDGTDIILMAQPFRAYVKTLLERQDYPTRRSAAGVPPDRPYDATGWTLPFQMHVRVDRVDQPFEPPATTRLDRALTPPARVGGETRKAGYYVIDGRGNGASLAINRLLKAGARLSWAAEPTLVQGFTYDAGAFVAAAGKTVGSAVEAVARQLGLRATAVAGKMPAGLRPIAAARVALYKPWVENVDEGWTRWVLEQYEFPFESITDADVRRGGLRARFDVVILPDQGAERLLTGHPPGTMPAVYTGGLGMDGAAMLKQFVDEGGTLVALDSSSELAVSLLGVPVRDVTRGLSADEFYCPGSIVRLELDADPLTYGLPRETAAFFAFSSAFELAPADASSPEPAMRPTARVVGRYGRDHVLMSGLLEGERVIAGKGAVVDVRSGLGRAVLLAFSAQHRGQSHATFRLLFNAIHTAR